MADGDVGGSLGQLDATSLSKGTPTASGTMPQTAIEVLWTRARATAHGIALVVGKTTACLCSKGVELSARFPSNGDKMVETPFAVELRWHTRQGAAGRAFASLRCELLLHFVRPEALA